MRRGRNSGPNFVTLFPIMMLSRLRSWIRIAGLALAGPAAASAAEDYAIAAFAGTSNVGGSTDGTPGVFSNPYGIAIDAAKNLYVTDTLNNTVRKITPGRVVSTVAGTAGLPGTADGTGTAARFNFPIGIAVDSGGNLYVADAKNFIIRKITAAGVVSTFAGAPFQIGATDGPAASARFFLPYGVATDSAGNVYVADGGNHTIRKITPAGVVSTLAGSPLQTGTTNGTGAAARFNTPWGIAVDGAGNVYVADSENHLIRKITAAGVVTTLAGAAGSAGADNGVGVAARFNQPRGLAVNAAGSVFVADYGNSTLRLVEANGTVSTLGGSPGIVGDTDSVGSAARFYNPTDVAADGNTAYVVDSSNNLIRRAQPASQADLPTITVQPLDQTVSVGQAVSFRTAAVGTALTYRWFKNGVLIAGVTSATYAIAAATVDDVAAYVVRISGAGGTVDSASALLAVQPAGSGAISITARPLSQNVNVGQAVSFSVTASGAGLTYQWLKDGVALAGATASTFALGSAQTTNAGTYTVRLTAGSTVETATAKLVVGTVTGAPFTITTQPASLTVNAGQAATFSVVATGSAGLTYQWLKNDSAISGATSATYAIASAAAADAGTYAVRVSGGGFNVLSGAAVLTVNTPVPTGPTSRLGNLSVRTALAQGQILIVGTVVSGGSRNVLVRAVGPALAAFGITTAMADPRLELYNGSTSVFSNDNWPSNLADTFPLVGAFGLTPGSRDAAFVQSIDGARSIWAQGTGPGVVLVEAYDTGTGNSPRLINVSARNRVGTGDDILIAGFNIAGTGTKRLLVRAVGPQLGAFGVSGFLADPKLEIYSGATKIAENDNWTSDLAATFSSVGAFGLTAGSRDAALLTTLATGSYTVQVSGVGGGTGEALIEIYEVP